MIPLRLTLSGFLSYLDPAVLDFTPFTVACISGANGAGKSSILDAITWVLFGQARRKDDSIIHNQATSAEVALDFEYEDLVYRVQRSKVRDKATALEFFVQAENGEWRPLSERSLRETEARIQQVLRLDFETFTNASFFLQGRADQFAQQRPADRKRILSSILGLEVWDVYRERAAAHRKEQENELLGVDARLKEVEEELQEGDERRARLKQLEEDLQRSAALRAEKERSLETLRKLETSLGEQRRLVQMLEAQASEGAARLENLEKELFARQAEIIQCRQRLESAPQIEAAYQRWQELRASLETWEAVAANFRQYDAQRQAPLLAIQAERSRLEQEAAGLDSERERLDEQAAALPRLEEQRAALEKNLKDLEERLSAAPALQQEWRDRQESLAEAGAENRRLKDEMAALKERIDRLKQTQGADCPLCGQPLTPDDRQRLVEELETQGRSMGDRYRANLDLVKNGEVLRGEQQKKIQELESLSAQLTSLQGELAGLMARQQQVMEVVQRWEEKSAPRRAELQSVLTKRDYAHEAQAQLAALDAQLKDLGYDAAAHEAARLDELEARQAEQLRLELETARAALAPLESAAAALQAQASEGRAALEKQEETLRQARTKYDADALALPDLLRVESEVRAMQESENQLRMQVGSAFQKVEVLKGLEVRRSSYAARRAEIGRQIDRLRRLEKAFGHEGVPALLIEQALPEIEQQANDILDRLTRGSMSVSFSTQKAYKDKHRDDLKETLDIIIRDPSGTREYELFSGGEAFRVNFAIRLALAKVLARRAGARLRTLVIDEGFGSQDADGRARLMEAIHLVQGDFRKILVITHLEELKDQFPARIEIEKHPGGSRLKVVA